MAYYADTSWWLALSHPPDRHHKKAWRLFDKDSQARVVWTPWQRVEVFNGLYQMERAGHLERGTAGIKVRQIETEIILGYWPHREFSWTNAVRRASNWAEQFGPRLVIRGMDLFHVAVARTVHAEISLTFDEDQKELVDIVGLKFE